LRGAFIVSFPGETGAGFQELLDWLDEAQLDRVGAVRYSPVEGAVANAVAQHVKIAGQEERLAAKVGHGMEVLVGSVDKNFAVACSIADAPEIDGVVHIVKGGKLPVGEFVDVEITGSSDHDLEAHVCHGAVHAAVRC